MDVGRFPVPSILGTHSTLPGAPVLPAPVQSRIVPSPTASCVCFVGVISSSPGAAGIWPSAGSAKQWRERVVEELHKRGVEASVRRLTLDPVRGLIAQDVRIYDFKNRDNTLAVISEVALDINYAALLHHQPFLNALDVRGAELTIPNPAGGPGAPKTQIKQFRAHIYFPPEQIYVSQAEGIFCGIRISATGQLIKRNDYKPSEEISEEDWRQRMLLMQRIADELRRFSFPGEAPIASGEIFRRSLPVRDRPRGSNFDGRSVAARRLTR